MSGKILIISDDVDFVEQVKSFKSDDYELVIESSAPKVDNNDSDIIICLADVSTVDIPESFFDTSKLQFVIILKKPDDNLLKSYENVAKDIWIKPLHPIILQKRLININEALKTYKSSRNLHQKIQSMIHEIKDPLTQIKGYSSVMLGGLELEEPIRQFVNIIHTSANRIMTIVDDNLYPRVETGPIRANLERIAVIEIIDEVIEAFRRFRPKPYSETEDFIAVLLDDNLPDVLVDKGRAFQILSNFAVLAMKINQNNEAIIIQGKKVGEYVQMSVPHILVELVDTNIDNLVASIDWKGTTDSTIENEVARTLLFSRAWVALLDGKIWVESEVGKGSTFHFTLPIYNPAVHGAE